jgi:hypothetical protein
LPSVGLLGLLAAPPGRVLVVTGAGFEAAVAGVNEPAWAGAMTVFRWGGGFRPLAPLCSDEGAMRPEVHTMASMSGSAC